MSTWIHVSPLPHYFDEMEVMQIFRDIGPIRRVHIDKHPVLLRVSAFVHFTQPKYARLAATRKDETVVGNTAIRVFVVWTPKENLSTVKVQNLTTNITDRELEDNFNPFGTVIDIRTEVNKDTVIALITYSKVEYALQAVQDMNGSVIQKCVGDGLQVQLLNPDARNLKWKRNHFNYCTAVIPKSHKSGPMRGGNHHNGRKRGGRSGSGGNSALHHHHRAAKTNNGGGGNNGLTIPSKYESSSMYHHPQQHPSSQYHHQPSFHQQQQYQQHNHQQQPHQNIPQQQQQQPQPSQSQGYAQICINGQMFQLTPVSSQNNPSNSNQGVNMGNPNSNPNGNVNNNNNNLNLAKVLIPASTTMGPMVVPASVSPGGVSSIQLSPLMAAIAHRGGATTSTHGATLAPPSTAAAHQMTNTNTANIIPLQLDSSVASGTSVASVTPSKTGGVATTMGGLQMTQPPLLQAGSSPACSSVGSNTTENLAYQLLALQQSTLSQSCGNLLSATVSDTSSVGSHNGSVPNQIQQAQLLSPLPQNSENPAPIVFLTPNAFTTPQQLSALSEQTAQQQASAVNLFLPNQSQPTNPVLINPAILNNPMMFIPQQQPQPSSIENAQQQAQHQQPQNQPWMGYVNSPASSRHSSTSYVASRLGGSSSNSSMSYGKGGSISLSRGSSRRSSNMSMTSNSSSSSGVSTLSSNSGGVTHSAPPMYTHPYSTNPVQQQFIPMNTMPAPYKVVVTDPMMQQQGFMTQSAVTPAFMRDRSYTNPQKPDLQPQSQSQYQPPSSANNLSTANAFAKPDGNSKSSANDQQWSTAQQQLGDEVFKLLKQEFPPNRVPKLTGMILVHTEDEIRALLNKPDQLKLRAQQCLSMLNQTENN